MSFFHEWYGTSLTSSIRKENTQFIFLKCPIFKKIIMS